MPRPVLGLLPARTADALLVRLLVRLSQWCDPRGPDPGLAAPRAWLAAAPDASGLSRALRSGRPCAIWAADAGAVRAAAALGPAVVLTPAPPAGQRHPAVLAVADDRPLDASAVDWQPPFVRARRRRALGLPPGFVVDLRPGMSMLSSEAEAAAVAVAAAVIAPARLVARALATGAPVVTDAASARSLGLRHNQEVVVASETTAAAAAVRLAGNVRLAPRLSWAARRWAEDRHDLRRAAAAVAGRLELAGDLGWRSAVDLQIDNLGTPRESPLRIRLEMLMEPLEEGR